MDHPKDPYIWELQGSLSKDFCKNLIAKFEADKVNPYQGRVFSGVNMSIKQSLDVNVSACKDVYSYEDGVLHQALGDGLEAYFQHIADVITVDDHISGERVRVQIFNGECADTGYQVQKTVPGGFYTWHNDDHAEPDRGHRCLTFIWYLNDVEEGGYTEFHTGQRVYPETGKLMFFPAGWSYMHRGYPPLKGDKYICTGWLYDKINPNE